MLDVKTYFKRHFSADTYIKRGEFNNGKKTDTKKKL